MVATHMRTSTASNVRDGGVHSRVDIVLDAKKVPATQKHAGTDVAHANSAKQSPTRRKQTDSTRTDR